MTPIFTIGIENGIPRLLKNGKATFPMMFWQTSITEEDGQAFSRLGVEVFTFTRSYQAYEHPYYVGENLYDFHFFDSEIEKFRRACPGKYCIPRVFVSAPYWWLEAHPEECYECIEPKEHYRHGLDKPISQGTLHESFASMRWRKDMGDALRALIRHIKESDYAESVIGLHIAGGNCGEWHYWGGLGPDLSKPMQDYIGGPIPKLEDRTPEFHDKFFQCEVESIRHFTRIVKEETNGQYLNVIFYGYLPPSGPCEANHRGAEAILDAPEIDIIAAPHSYDYRAPGDSAYFRNFVASVAAHGKLFVDESDDRTWLSRRKHPGRKRPLGASNPEDSVMIIRREFGYALTHNTGLWYMDIDDDAFHSPLLLSEIDNMKQWGEKSLAKPRTRCSEVALFFDMRGAYCLPNNIKIRHTLFFLTAYTLNSLCRAGAPFDCYLAGDVILPQISRYKVLIFADLIDPSPKVRKAIERLKNSNRTLIWSYGSGLVKDGRADIRNMIELTGLKNLQMVESLELPENAYNPRDIITPAVSPMRIQADFNNWRSVYESDICLTTAFLRREYRKAEVWNYTDSEDVLSLSDGALMLHATTTGHKTIRLQRPRHVTDIILNSDLGMLQIIELEMERNETRIFLLD